MIFNPDSETISFGYDEDEEEKVDPREHYAALVADVRAMMKKIQKAPNENFPEFLWNPGQNDFSNEDEFYDPNQYIEMGLGHIVIDNGAEIIDSIKGLKNRYKDYFKYIDALDIWYRYYDFIVETYGDFDFFANLVQSGSISVPLRRKPKLKSAKGNKYLLEIKVPLSRINREDGLTDEEIAEIGKNYPDQLEVYEDYYEYIDHLSKYNKNEEKRLQRESRVRNYARTSSVVSPDRTALDDYLNSISNNSNYGYSSGNRPLSDDLEAFHEYDGYDEDLKNDLMGLRRKTYVDTNYHILCQTSEDTDAVDLYTELAKNGYEVGMLMKNSSMNREAVKMITRQFDDEKSIKKMKKMKKKKLKNEKKLQKALTANEQVRNILTKNKVSFDPDDRMLSFTLSDIQHGGI